MLLKNLLAKIGDRPQVPTRSTKLASALPAAATPTSVLVVPNGYTYLVKTAMAFNNSGAADNVQCWVQDPLGLLGFLIRITALGAAVTAQWEGWVALNPGDQLFVYSGGGVSQFWLSGTKLPGVA